MPPQSQRQKPDGSALIIVLWAVAVVSTALVGLAVYFQGSIEEQTGRNARFRTLLLAESGLAFGLHPEVKRTDPLLRQEISPGEGFEVAISSEGSRLNINAALLANDDELLRNLFSEWGVAQENLSPLIDALHDWIDDNEFRRLNGAEEPEYAALGLRGLPRNQPFVNPDELALVIGWRWVEEVRPGWRDDFTVWSSGKVDLNDAPADLIAVAAEIPVDQVDTLIRYRNGDDEIFKTEDDNELKSVDEARVLLGMGPAEFDAVGGRFSVSDPIRRVESTGKAGNYQRSIIAIARAGNENPALLAWMERAPNAPE